MEVTALSRSEASRIDEAWIEHRFVGDQHTFAWSAIRAHAKRCSFKVELWAGGAAPVVVAAFAV